ncbi:7092_t:CDS:2, partial [Cetraspora pellucida]
KEIVEFQHASRNKNTDKLMNIWMDLLYKFCQLHEYLDDLKALDDKTISEQLEQFIIEVCKSNGQEYKVSLLYTGFCAIARRISEAFENIRAINLFDKHKFKNLHRTLDGHMKSIIEKGDKNRKQSDPLETDEIKLLLDSSATSINDPKASWLKELENGGMQLELPKEKNHAGGIKDPYAEAGSSFILPDISENMYTPVADIKKSHNTMMHSMCKDAKLDFKGHTIMNHSMRLTGIHSFVESGITLDKQMIFSQHKTIASVSAYQHQSLKHKLDNVSHLIRIEEA